MKTGVIAFQGDFQKHIDRVRELGSDALPVRTVAALDECDALVVPGGESTTIGMLMERFGLLDALRPRVSAGFPVFGTCAGAILLADAITGSTQPRIGGLDIEVERNAYGRQIASFEADLQPRDGLLRSLRNRDDTTSFHGVFIRAPKIVSAGPEVEVLLSFEDVPVMVQAGNLLAATFHPELTGDRRLHAYFLEVASRTV